MQYLKFHTYLYCITSLYNWKPLLIVSQTETTLRQGDIIALSYVEYRILQCFGKHWSAYGITW